jgi:hypothetical protein
MGHSPFSKKGGTGIQRSEGIDCGRFKRKIFSENSRQNKK